MLSLAGANCNTALCGTQLTQSSFPPGNANNRPGQSAPLQDAPRQLYEANQPYRSYLKPDEKGVYQVVDKTMEDQPEDFYTIFDANGENVAYLDEGFDEVVINFVGIETSYSKYHSFFPSRSKLHKHIKAGGVREALPSSSTQLFSLIPVVVSTAVHQSFASGLAFRGWTYAIIAITLDAHRLPRDPDPKLTACLDTGCRVTLVDKS